MIVTVRLQVNAQCCVLFCILKKSGGYLFWKILMLDFKDVASFE